MVPSNSALAHAKARERLVFHAFALLAILENNQQADGSITIPPVLHPGVGKDTIRPKPA
jgi:seryl-tRNA synthetase